MVESNFRENSLLYDRVHPRFTPTRMHTLDRERERERETIRTQEIRGVANERMSTIASISSSSIGFRETELPALVV